MISITKSLGAIMCANLLESQAWERHISSLDNQRMIGIGGIKTNKIGNYVISNPGSKITWPKSTRNFYSMSKSKATSNVPGIKFDINKRKLP